MAHSTITRALELQLRRRTVSDGSLTVTLGDVFDEIYAGNPGVAVEVFALWFTHNYPGGPDEALGVICRDKTRVKNTIDLYLLIEGGRR